MTLNHWFALWDAWLSGGMTVFAIERLREKEWGMVVGNALMAVYGATMAIMMIWGR